MHCVGLVETRVFQAKEESQIPCAGESLEFLRNYKKATKARIQRKESAR